MKAVNGHEAMITPNNDAALQQCFVCGGAIADGWFCRIPRERGQILLCSPQCLRAYCDESNSLASHRSTIQA